MPFEDPGHLPNRRGGEPLEPGRLPRQRRGTTPQMHGRYPDHDVLAHADRWDEPTRRVVLARLQPPAYRFFSGGEIPTLECLCDVVLAQDGEPRIPVLRFVDDALVAGRRPGFRYAGMPDDGEAWHRVGRGLNELAVERGTPSFASLDDASREEIVGRFSGGKLSGGVWDSMPVTRAWQVVTHDMLTAYYAHPWAWNEIGFGGPAYPRGYMRLGIEQHDPWEGREAEGLARSFQDDVEADPDMRP